MELHLFDLDNDSDSYSDSDYEGDSENIHVLATKREAVQHRATQLLALFKKFFPEDEAELFVLHHDDLNPGNILVDADDNLAGVIDWECVHTVPLYYTCQMPKFLDVAMDRSICPDPDKYPRDTEDDGTIVINEAYYEHLEEYENQRLWAFFLEEMGRACPEWFKVYEQGKVKTGLENCIVQFGNSMRSVDIDTWLGNVEETGNGPSLQGLRREAHHRFNNYGC